MRALLLPLAAMTEAGHRRSWHPLLDAPTADRAKQAIADIGQALGPTTLPGAPASRHASLIAGDAGIALFYVYAARAGLAENGRERARQLLDRALSVMASSPLTPSLYHGFVGIAWVAQAVSDDLYRAGSEDPNAA